MPQGAQQGLQSAPINEGRSPSETGDDTALEGQKHSKSRLASLELPAAVGSDGEAPAMTPRTGAEMQTSFLAANAASSSGNPLAAAHKLADAGQIGGVQRFEELVQAISNAREAGTNQPVKATLSHAEFGVVALRLSRDDGGLSAVISSADPGFGQAAHAAVRTLGDANASGGRNDEHARHSHGGADLGGQNASQSSQQSSAGQEQRSQHAAKSERHDAPRAAPSPDKKGDTQSRASRDGGIYA